MKEAAGEANLTVVAILLIAVVVAVATPLVNSLMTTSRRKSCCTEIGGIWMHSGATGFCTRPPNDKGSFQESAVSDCMKH